MKTKKKQNPAADNELWTWAAQAAHAKEIKSQAPEFRGLEALRLGAPRKLLALLGVGRREHGVTVRRCPEAAPARAD
ncbi:MAG: hypothetical protein ACOYNN_06120 [Terrimicrobiaceae bacterium]